MWGKKGIGSLELDDGWRRIVIGCGVYILIDKRGRIGIRSRKEGLHEVGFGVEKKGYGLSVCTSICLLRLLSV